MSCFAGPEIVNTGLIFHYDIHNTEKSWKGKPTTNLLDPNIKNWTGNAIITESSEKSPIGATCYSITDNNASAYLSISKTITVPNDSNTYTLQIYIKKTYGGTSARLGFNTGFTGGTTVAYNQRFNSDTGVATSGTVTSQNEWWKWTFQITNNSSGNTELYCYFYPATGPYNSSDNVSGTGTVVLSGIQLEQNSFATPFVDGTRTNEQSLLDLTKNNIIIPNNLTYNSDNTFMFDNADDYCTVSSNTSFSYGLGDFAWDFWVKFSTLGSNDYVLDHNSNQGVIHYYSGGLRYYNPNTATGSPLYDPTPINANVWYNVTISRISGITYFYINKNLIKQGQDLYDFSISKLTLGNYGGGGNYFFNGYLSSLKIYKGRGLSATEIQQNFETSRDRYGI